MSAIRRAAITGGPGAGKSTLLNALAEAGVAIEPEVARALLRAPGGMALRNEDPLAFADAMVEAQVRTWSSRRGEGPVVYDRGLPDIVGFLQVGGLPVAAAIDRACRELRFDGPIFRAPPWREIYAPDDQRIQSWEEALASDRAVANAWRHYGYELIDLPQASVEERTGFVLDRL